MACLLFASGAYIGKRFRYLSIFISDNFRKNFPAISGLRPPSVPQIPGTTLIRPSVLLYWTSAPETCCLTSIPSAFILRGWSCETSEPQTLLKLRDKIDPTKMKNSSFLMVLVGIGEIAYRREDGVYVVPIGCLKD